MGKEIHTGRIAMSSRYDAIVVGARCAGSPTAMLLARKGYHVLLVDRATFPQRHTVDARGACARVAALDRWGLLDEVRASGCPPIQGYSLDLGPVKIAGTPRAVGGHSEAYAPRRTVLDTVLINAARAAGVDVCERFNVDEIVVEDAAVIGIRGHDESGAQVIERARVVIGADGRNSRVAKADELEQYNEKPRMQWSYYTYFRGLPTDGFEIFDRGDRGWAAAATNDGLTMVVVGWPIAEAASYRADVEANFYTTLDRAPEFAARVRGAERVEPFNGGSVPGYLRKPYGPGCVLVGDAGYNRDPVTAQGISDAFRDADLVAAAVDAWSRGDRTFDAAMLDYQSTRDASVGAVYEFTTLLAMLQPPPQEQQMLIGAVYGNQDAMDDFVSMFAGTVSPAQFFDAANVDRIFEAAAARDSEVLA